MGTKMPAEAAKFCGKDIGFICNYPQSNSFAKGISCGNKEIFGQIDTQ